MNVQEKAARKFLAAMYKPEAADWSTKRIEGRLNSLKDPSFRMKAPEGKERVLFDAIMAAVDAGEGVVVITEQKETPVQIKENSNKTRKASKSAGRVVRVTAKTDGGPSIQVKPVNAKNGRKEQTNRGTGGPSSKEIVYKLQRKIPKITARECFEKVGERVTLGTIRVWFSSWKRGRDLPACARK